MPLSKETFVIPTKVGIHHYQVIVDSCACAERSRSMRRNDANLMAGTRWVEAVTPPSDT